MPIATTATASSGTALSSATTRRSTPQRHPVSRSRLNGRLRSVSPPTTLTARLHPASARLATMTTLASCFQPGRCWRSPASKSPGTVGGRPRRSGTPASRTVRARSSAAADPSVPTTTDTDRQLLRARRRDRRGRPDRRGRRRSVDGMRPVGTSATVAPVGAAAERGVGQVGARDHARARWRSAATGFSRTRGRGRARRGSRAARRQQPGRRADGVSRPKAVDSVPAASSRSAPVRGWRRSW